MNAYDEMMRLYDVAANKEYKIGELEDTVNELKDALEFEARVAVKIAQNYTRYTCTGISTCNRFSWDESKRQCRYAIENCVIWKARLAVEENMDG